MLTSSSVVFTTVATIFSIIILTSSNAVAAEQFMVSKSTTMYLADSKSRQLQPRGLMYLPAGVRLIGFDKKITYRGLLRRLILTETGLWGYIIVGSKHYWSGAAIDDFKKSNNIVFVKRKFAVTIPLGTSVGLAVTLTRGEFYPLKEDLGETIKILIGKRKIGEKFGTLAFEVPVERDYLSALNLNTPFRSQDINPYSKSIIDGIAGIEKACDTRQVTGIRFGERAGFSLERFFVELGISQSVERSRTEQFGENVSVTRTYYSRLNRSGRYTITKIQSCRGRQTITYRVVAPDNRNITIDEEWAKEVGLKTDRRTGQILVSCAPYYSKLASELSKRGFLDDENPFIISRTASFNGIGKINSC